MNINEQIMTLAKADIGTWEFAGDDHNPKVLAYYDDAGHPEIGNDEVPWCAAFVGAILVRAGGKGTNSLLAQSYLKWGVKVDIKDAKPGDVVVIKRGSKSWQGHVFFFHSWHDAKTINGLGGNQGDQVNVKKFRIDDGKLLGVRRSALMGDVPLTLDGSTGIRRPDMSQTGYPIIKRGFKGRFVKEAQELLRSAGHYPGAVDADFGRNTYLATISFQADNGLKADGIIGDETWTALMVSDPPQERDVSIKDLRAGGSTTVKAADTGQTVAIAGSGITAAVTVLDQVNGASNSLTEAEGSLSTIQSLLEAYWPILAVAAIGFVVWRGFGQIKQSRLSDARSGKHMGR